MKQKYSAAAVAALDWPRIEADLDSAGVASTGPILTPAECAGLAALYADDGNFRSRVVMARHGFGSGEYKYFDYPLPAHVADLRAAFYPRLAAIANRWSAALGAGVLTIALGFIIWRELSQGPGSATRSLLVGAFLLVVAIGVFAMAMDKTAPPPSAHRLTLQSEIPG